MERERTPARDSAEASVGKALGAASSAIGRLAAASAQRGLQEAHKRQFSAWLSYSLAQQHGDLEQHLIETDGDLGIWLSLETYRSLVPPGASEIEARLFLCDLEANLAALRNRYMAERREGSKALVERLLDLIEHDLHASLKVISADLGVSARTLGAAFKRRTGLTFHRYLRILRLLKAIEPLASGRHTVEDAAGSSGYVDSRKLWRDCVELIGTSPARLQQSLAAVRAGKHDLICRRATT